MRTIEAEEARVQFQDVLRAVESGETVVVTVRGVPVAHRVPVQERYEDAAEAIEDLEALPKGTQSKPWATISPSANSSSKVEIVVSSTQ